MQINYIGLTAWSFGVTIEKIADGSKTLKIDRVFGIALKIFAEPDDEVVDGAGGGFPGIPPADLQQFFTRKRLATIGNKQFEYFGFLFSQGNLTQTTACGMGFKIDAIVAKMKGVEGWENRIVVFLIPADAFEQTVDAKKQFLQVEGFGQIIVHPEGKPLDPVIRIALGRED